MLGFCSKQDAINEILFLLGICILGKAIAAPHAFCMEGLLFLF